MSGDKRAKAGLIILVGMGVVTLIAFVSSLPAITSSYQPKVQTASATTDYFSWNCEHLKNEVNQHLTPYASNGLANTSDNSYADGLLLIMEIKGCSPYGLAGQFEP